MADPAVGPQRDSLIWTAATRHTLSREQASLSMPSPWGPTLLLCPGRVPKASRLKWTRDRKLFAAPLYEAV